MFLNSLYRISARILGEKLCSLCHSIFLMFSAKNADKKTFSAKNSEKRDEKSEKNDKNCKFLASLSASFKSAYTAAFIWLSILLKTWFSVKIAKIESWNSIGIVNGVKMFLDWRTWRSWRLLVRNLELVYCQSNLPKLEILTI